MTQQKIGNNSPNNTASHPGHESSTTPLWKPQASQFLESYATRVI